MVDRDSEVGGGIMAGSLAYRLFIWLLPFSLVLVAGIGIGADVASESTASATTVARPARRSWPTPLRRPHSPPRAGTRS